MNPVVAAWAWVTSLWRSFSTADKVALACSVWLMALASFALLIDLQMSASTKVLLVLAFLGVGYGEIRLMIDRATQNALTTAYLQQAAEEGDAVTFTNAGVEHAWCPRHGWGKVAYQRSPEA